jgi:hypothetical protein
LDRGSRRRVAREAALLLYKGLIKEYKQAKEMAAETLGTRTLPSNLEVAFELDRMVDEIEGLTRKELIVKLRRLALQVMLQLREFHPKVVGSVWRGTACKGSDIDILAFTTDPKAVIDTLLKNGFKVVKTEWHKKVEDNRVKNYFHIYLNLLADHEVEVIVRNPEDLHIREKCDIYGDVITGLTLSQLEEVLEQDPQRKFVPKEK